MRIWKMVIAIMLACILMAGCGAANTAQAPATAETTAPATAETTAPATTDTETQAITETAEPAITETAEPATTETAEPATTETAPATAAETDDEAVIIIYEDGLRLKCEPEDDNLYLCTVLDGPKTGWWFEIEPPENLDPGEYPLDKTSWYVLLTLIREDDGF